MALSDNLDVQSLDFPEIKQNFISFLKGDPNYQDFNFNASGIGTILNIASYQTHYLGFFVKMLLDESFIDSAHTRQALLSHAKKTGYIPKGYQSASAQVLLTITTTTDQEPSTHNIQIPRGSTFKSTNDSQDTRVFTILDGTTLYNRTVNGNIVTYTSEVLTIYEGTVKTQNFIADSSVENQMFVIKDTNIDIDTIRVKVFENSTSTTFKEFILAKDVLELTPESEAFFISTNEQGYYQIFFGNDVFGIQPGNGNTIQVDYISTNGESGNGARSFQFNPGIMNYSNYVVTTQSVSSGGAAPQTIEELRFAIPQANKRQNRVVTTSDYHSVLLDEFRNIESINVQGGEENAIRDYGKVYVSAKPYYSDSLTSLAKEEISNNIVKKYGIVGGDIVFVDPDFINIDLTLVTTLDLRNSTKTKAEIFNMIQQNISEYNSNSLSKFGSNLSDVDMLAGVKNVDKSITSVYSIKVLNKNFNHLYGTTSSSNVVFGNKLVPGSITSSVVTYGNLTVKTVDDSNGNLRLVNSVTGAVVVSNSGTVDYDKGIITYNLPAAVTVDGYSGSYGTITWSAAPAVPDINTTLNNIVRINTVVVK